MRVFWSMYRESSFGPLFMQRTNKKSESCAYTRQKTKIANSRLPDGSLHTCVSDLNSHDWVQFPHSRLEGDQCWILVGEHAEEAVLDAHCDASGDCLLSGHEPVVLLCRLIY